MLLDTPKLAWRGVNVRAELTRELGLPVAIDTDVNAAALAEVRFGAAQGCPVAVYVTVGTGVGGGVVIGGRPLHGLLHPEIGHLRVRRLPDGRGVLDALPGTCPYHGDCLEGLISGPAVASRAGRPGQELAEEDPAWEVTGKYLGIGLASIVLSLSPVRVVIGGGVGTRPAVLRHARRALLEELGGYLRRPQLTPEGVGKYLVPPGLGDRAGIVGAFELAADLASKGTEPVVPGEMPHVRP